MTWWKLLSSRAVPDFKLQPRRKCNTIWSAGASVSSATDDRVLPRLFAAMVWPPEFSSLFQVLLASQRWFVRVTIPTQIFASVNYSHIETFFACQQWSQFCSGKTIMLAYFLHKTALYSLSGYLYDMFEKKNIFSCSMGNFYLQHECQSNPW